MKLYFRTLVPTSCRRERSGRQAIPKDRARTDTHRSIVICITDVCYESAFVAPGSRVGQNAGHRMPPKPRWQPESPRHRQASPGRHRCPGMPQAVSSPYGPCQRRLPCLCPSLVHQCLPAPPTTAPTSSCRPRPQTAGWNPGCTGPPVVRGRCVRVRASKTWFTRSRRAARSAQASSPIRSIPPASAKATCYTRGTVESTSPRLCGSPSHTRSDVWSSPRWLRASQSRREGHQLFRGSVRAMQCGKRLRRKPSRVPIRNKSPDTTLSSVQPRRLEHD
jgi:hypothetical protein